MAGEGEAGGADVGAEAAGDAVEGFACGASAEGVGCRWQAASSGGGDGGGGDEVLGFIGEVEEVDGDEGGGADVDAPSAGDAGVGRFADRGLADGDGIGPGGDGGEEWVDLFAGEHAIEDDLAVVDGDMVMREEFSDGLADASEGEASVRGGVGGSGGAVEEELEGAV